MFFFKNFFSSETLFRLVNVLRFCHAVPSQIRILCLTVLKFETFSPRFTLTCSQRTRIIPDCCDRFATHVQGSKFSVYSYLSMPARVRIAITICSFSPTPPPLYISICIGKCLGQLRIVVHREQLPMSDFLFTKI